MQQGWTNADACREVGVHRRTGGRWRNGRVVKVPGGEARIYPPISSGPVAVDSDRYLNQDERIVIADGIRAGLSRRAIAALLPGRAVSTVCREMARNRDQETGNYRPHAAHRDAAHVPSPASSRATRCCALTFSVCSIAGGAPSRSPPA
jgi:hypothetical protein